MTPHNQRANNMGNTFIFEMQSGGVTIISSERLICLILQMLPNVWCFQNVLFFTAPSSNLCQIYVQQSLEDCRGIKTLLLPSPKYQTLALVLFPVEYRIHNLSLSFNIIALVLYYIGWFTKSKSMSFGNPIGKPLRFCEYALLSHFALLL